MQPLSTGTNPSSQVPSGDLGTHAPATHTRSALPQSLVISQGCFGTEQMPLSVSQALPFSILAVLGIVHDLTRVQIVCRHMRLFRAMREALRAVRRRLGSLLVAWSARALAAISALFCGVMIARHLGVEESGSFALGAAVHQLVLLFAVAARVSWLAAAMRLSEDDDHGAPESQ